METRGIRRHLRISAVLVLGVAFTLWTWVTVAGHLPAWIDASGHSVHLRANTWQDRLFTTIAMDTHPVVVSFALACVAFWTWRRRLRQLTVAIFLGWLLSWPLGSLLKLVFQRARPSVGLTDGLGSAVAHGYSYPSTHMSTATAAAILVIVTTTTTRQTQATVFAWRVLGVAGVSLVAYDRWVTSAHWISDIIGGLLLGMFAAVAGLVLAGVRMLPDLLPPRRVSDRRPVCAVIHNPAKVTDNSTFRRHVEWELRHRGWYDALWLETTRSDPGVAMAQQALHHGVDLVLVAGGDGTVRAVCSTLANSGVPVGIIPAGTGNLLARNLGIPLDETSALNVAFAGVSEQVDLIRVRIDKKPPQMFAVMAGLGIDARVMAATNAELKRTVGSAAYFIAAAQQVGSKPDDLTVSIDGAKPMERASSLAVVGNVGVLQAGIQLIPQATANDGLLDVIVASAPKLSDWASLISKALVRAGRDNDPRVLEMRGTKVRFDMSRPTPYELDGDVEGLARTFEAEIVPRALTIKLPRPLPESPTRENQVASHGSPD